MNLKRALQKLERDYESLTGELESVHLKSRSQVNAIDDVYTKVLLEDETRNPVDEDKVDIETTVSLSGLVDIISIFNLESKHLKLGCLYL